MAQWFKQIDLFEFPLGKHFSIAVASCQASVLFFGPVQRARALPRVQLRRIVGNECDRDFVEIHYRERAAPAAGRSRASRWPVRSYGASSGREDSNTASSVMPISSRQTCLNVQTMRQKHTCQSWTSPYGRVSRDLAR